MRTQIEITKDELRELLKDKLPLGDYISIELNGEMLVVRSTVGETFLKVGRKYRNREGDVMVVVGIGEKGFRAAFLEDGGEKSSVKHHHKPNGEALGIGGVETDLLHEYDLIEEVEDE
jgi:hypothetical protein